ncbi:hypothetical protein DPMN_079478 [Dreissena polymorpha]|uniref:Uncharacterized protein n=1 Tax=Dreissena polymorpha TaxID=45954 RepID=A0A9D3YP41_DREPO|nr:hypothetical protein DPMN_079478 [Dreissena polymorpha]
MPPELFDEILERISQVISRQDAKFRSSLTPETGTDSDAFGYRKGQLCHFPMRFGAVRQQFVIWFLKYAALLSRPTTTKCSPFL